MRPLAFPAKEDRDESGGPSKIKAMEKDGGPFAESFGGKVGRRRRRRKRPQRARLRRFGGRSRKQAGDQKKRDPSKEGPVHQRGI